MTPLACTQLAAQDSDPTAKDLFGSMGLEPGCRVGDGWWMVEIADLAQQVGSSWFITGVTAMVKTISVQAAQILVGEHSNEAYFVHVLDVHSSGTRF